jgi:hypothetical protein
MHIYLLIRIYIHIYIHTYIYIYVLSATAKCLRMTKAKFDEIMSITKMFSMGGARATINEGMYVCVYICVYMYLHVCIY